MWSTGVILYVLLTGYNPFEAALQKDKKQIENEVLRLVARGQFDDTSERWLSLDSDAKNLICSTIQVTAQRRPSPTEALRHPYLMRCLARSGDKMQAEPAWRRANREDAWAQLDGFQRLAWVAIARAVGEPELHSEVVSLSLRAVRARSARGGASTPATAYLLQLAQEISALPKNEWLQDLASWEEVLRLAFTYLDVDGDKLLSRQDLACHIEAPSASEADLQVESWMRRWDAASGEYSTGLTIATLRAALLDSCSADSDSRVTEDGVLNVAACIDMSRLGWPVQETSRLGRADGQSDTHKLCELAST